MNIHKPSFFKKISSLLLTFIMVFTLMPLDVKAADSVSIIINETNFPDKNFREFVKQYDLDSSGALSDVELKKVLKIDVNSLEITDLTGIEHFTSLEDLRCQSNQLTTIDLSKNTALKVLFCWSNQLTSLDISNNTDLVNLICYNNAISALDLSKLSKLTQLDCNKNNLSSLDIKTNTELLFLDCSYNPISSLDVSNNPLLKVLQCNYTNITNLDTSNNPNISTFSLSNELTIALATDNTFDLKNLPEYSVKKILSLNDATLSDTILSIDDYTDYFSFDYDLGNNRVSYVYVRISHVHNPKAISAKASTCEEYGRKAYYQCKECNKCFEDKECKKEIKEDIREWRRIAKEKHTFDDTTLKITKATPYQNGVIIRKCKTCNREQSEIILCPNNITLSKDAYTYNGKTNKPTVTITDSSGKIITTSNFDISYAKGCKNVGAYDVIITFKGDYYTGDTVKTFTINPKNTSLKKPSAGKKSITVKWKKLTKKMKKSRITGYEIQYSTSSKFKGAKIKKVKGYKSTSIKLTKLKAKKKYYVRIRTYMTVNKKTCYSPWSKAKTVKTK